MVEKYPRFPPGLVCCCELARVCVSGKPPSGIYSQRLQQEAALPADTRWQYSNIVLPVDSGRTKDDGRHFSGWCGGDPPSPGNTSNWLRVDYPVRRV